TRGVVLDAASKFDNSLVSAARPDDRLAAQLQDQSSSLRLAESMGADYLLSASLASITKRKRNINAYGVQVANYEYTLRLAYSIFDANGGGSLTGGVVR